jgi:hypothetical protein
MKTISFERVMLSLIFIAVLYACYLLMGTSRKAFNEQGPLTTSATTGSDSTAGKDTVPKIGQTIYVIDQSAADCDCCPRQMKLYLKSTTTDTTGGSGGGPHLVYEVYRIDQE